MTAMARTMATVWLGLGLLAGATIPFSDAEGQTGSDPVSADADSSAPVLRVSEIATGKSYDPEFKAPVDTASVFSPEVGRVICYTRILGASAPVQVTHVWYYEGKTMAKVLLPVGSANWRTYSSKKIWPSWTGRWEVKVLDPSGVLLATKSFTIQ